MLWKLFRVCLKERSDFMQQPTYDEQITMKNEMKLRELCAGLPAFCKEFFVELNQQLLLGHELLMLMI